MDPNASNFDPRMYGSGGPDYGASASYPVMDGGASYSFNMGGAPPPPQQQGMYGGPAVAGYGSNYDNSYYPPTQQQQSVQPPMYYGNEYGTGAPAAVSVAPNNYHEYQPPINSQYTVQEAPSISPQVQESVAPGELYPIESIAAQVSGAPITALAYDTKYQAVFVASATQSLTRGRFNHRASMLVTHSTVDGMLYSSVAGHPEAPPKVLKNLYGAIYSTGGGGTSIHSLNNSRNVVPNHAFRPSYGTTDPALPDSTTQAFQMGINDLLPLGEGYVASVSPSAVRVHAHGGLQTADFHTEGMLSMTAHPNQENTVTHLTVGGRALERGISQNSGRSDLLCLDLWQGMRVIASYTAATSSRGGGDTNVAFTALATSHTRGSVIAGGSDGHIRIFDSRLREIAKLKSHLGGVVDLAVSDDGNILATAGYGSRGSSSLPLYSFPDPNVYCYDMRYLGRGGIPHPFAGLNGGPRHLSFLPPMDGVEQNRLLTVSGQVGGGAEIIVPFQERVSSVDADNFLVPLMEHGESITAMHVQDDLVGLGTSGGNLLQYRIAEFKSKTISRKAGIPGIFVPGKMNTTSLDTAPKAGIPTVKGKNVLDLPASFQAALPELSIDPKILIKGNPERRNGPNDAAKSIFSSYNLGQSPSVSSIKDNLEMRYGPLASEAMVGSSKNLVLDSFIAKAPPSIDFVSSVPASQIGIELLKDHRPEWVTAHRVQANEPRTNPNKFLYQSKLYAKVYMDSFNRFKKRGRRTTRKVDGDGKDDTGLLDVPPRYRLSIRPTNKSAAGFSHAEHNNTGLLPGWDYGPTMPNAFVPPILMLLYFLPEARATLLRSQFADKASIFGKKDGVMAEMSFLFHRIDSLARHALVFPSSGTSTKAKLGAWSPSNFVACLGTMPEAEQLQILDGSPAAVDPPRRPEAFYRFVLYQLDKELGKGTSAKMMDNLCGVDFVSVNEFISNSVPTVSSTRAMTVELYYEPFLAKGDPNPKKPSFGEVLYRTLSRETRLRAFNRSSGSYETIVQRKIALSLPKVLSISCACAGRKEEDGLFVWRGDGISQDHWLPEIVEVEISEAGNIVVRELIRELDSGNERWVSYGENDSVSAAVTDILSKRKGRIAQKLRYELNSVVSMVRDDLDKNIPDELVSANDEDGESFGHHVLHTRISPAYEKRIVKSQIKEATTFLSKPAIPFSLVLEKEKEAIKERVEHASNRLNEPKADWVLFNGFNVSNTSAEDARAFHVHFKEPCIVVYRCQEEASTETTDEIQVNVPPDVISTRSLTDNTRSNFASNQKLSALPGERDLVAFDAEFVSVQEEVSTLTESGSKLTIQETRHAMARISVVSCTTKSVVFDDFVLPLEEVVDYLTRFSGIVERDLNPKESEQHLISTRAAYLKLRCLVERGCVFVGHGLDRDFWTANLMVPPNQIIDTVEIYHKPAQRFISLRFLANYVLKRDMQQEVHDSLEDATAAFDLYETAVKLKEQGEFDKMLDSLYEYGARVDWKLGIE